MRAYDMTVVNRHVVGSFFLYYADRQGHIDISESRRRINV